MCFFLIFNSKKWLFKLCHKLCYKKLVFALRLGGWAQFPAKSYKGPKKYDPINGSLLIKGVTIDILSYKGIMGKLFLREGNITPTWINMQSILFIMQSLQQVLLHIMSPVYLKYENPQSFFILVLDLRSNNKPIFGYLILDLKQNKKNW